MSVHEGDGAGSLRALYAAPFEPAPTDEVKTALEILPWRLPAHAIGS